MKKMLNQHLSELSQTLATFFTHYLYIIGLGLVTFFSLYLNWDNPPNFDEAHAWNIARFLSPVEIFTISKTEGHPFLWYYLLMPMAKINLFYPWSLYLLNLIIILLSLYFLYKYAPIPTHTKYLITLSAPFLKAYSSFARSYSLSILLLFIILSLYPKRHKKNILYLSLIILLANTNMIALFAAFPLGLIYLIETLIQYKKEHKTTQILIALSFALLEALLLYLQFYNYDAEVPAHLPMFNTVTINLNNTFYPLNIYTFGVLTLISIYIFLRTHKYFALLFLVLSYLSMAILFATVYKCTVHHYIFFYVYLFAAYWIACMENSTPLTSLQFLPLSIIALCLIFNPNLTYKLQVREYHQTLRNAAQNINQIFEKKPANIFFLEPFDSTIISPYLDENISIYNQTATEFRTLKGAQQLFYYFYKPINALDIVHHLKNNTNNWLFRSCKEQTLHNEYMEFHLIYHLNKTYCLYNITLR